MIYHSLEDGKNLMIYIAEMQMLLSRAFLSWATCATGSENATLSLPAYIVSACDEILTQSLKYVHEL
jgi:hypothetical protein